MSELGPTTSFRWPRPGPALGLVMGLVFAVWLVFATGVAGADLFRRCCGNTQAIVHGEVWRLLTAPLVHQPDTLTHIVLVLIGLYFLSPSLERGWGSARFVRFLVGAAVIAYALQISIELVLPERTARRMVGEYWYGLGPVVDAIAIAWALSFRGRRVELFFVREVSSRTLVLFVVAIGVLALVFGGVGPSGRIAPFGGMAAGWLFAGGSPPPWRRAWLKLRLRWHERELQRLTRARQERVKRSGLRVLPGGQSPDARVPDRNPEAEPDDGSPPSSGSGPGGRVLH